MKHELEAPITFFWHAENPSKSFTKKIIENRESLMEWTCYIFCYFVFLRIIENQHKFVQPVFSFNLAETKKKRRKPEAINHNCKSRIKHSVVMERHFLQVGLCVWNKQVFIRFDPNTWRFNFRPSLHSILFLSSNSIFKWTLIDPKHPKKNTLKQWFGKNTLDQTMLAVMSVCKATGSCNLRYKFISAEYNWVGEQKLQFKFQIS